MIRILLVDDHTLVRAGLQRLLELSGDMEVVTAERGEEAIALAAAAGFDVVLMDVSMPGIGGIEAARRLTGLAPAPAVVMLTASSDRHHVMAALDAGAVGYLVKDAEPGALVDGVRSAARGDSPLDARAARLLLESRSDEAKDERSRSGLTGREREVLALVGDGLANKAIARRLGISEKTVKAHLTRVFAELGVSDRTQAALWARDHLQQTGS